MTVQDLWLRKDGSPSKRHGTGARYRARAAGITRAFRTRGAAERWLRGHEQDPWTPSDVTVQTLLTRWEATKAGLARKTVQAAKDAAAVVAADWGQVVAQTITRPAVQEWVAGLKRGDGEPASASTKTKALQALSGALRIGVEMGMLKENVAAGVTTPASVPREPQFLTGPDLAALADKCGHYRVMVLFLGTTGLRIGEAVALNVGSVTGSRVRVTAAMAKTRRGRDVPVPATVRGLLDLERPATAPLFTSPNGHRVDAQNFSQRVWRRVAPEGLRVHDLRHTAASLAVASGADVKVVQRMLGHKSAAMTLDVYAGLWDRSLDDVAARMDRMLAG